MAPAFVIHPVVDDWFKKPLVEVEIKERRFVSEPPSYSTRYSSYQPDTWTLHVVNENGQGWVSVSQPLYNSVRVGDKVFVQSTIGRLSKRWKWEIASKPFKERSSAKWGHFLKNTRQVGLSAM